MSIGFLASIKAGVSTLTSRLTSTRAGYLDNLDAAMSSRAPASTALSSATWTATRAGYLDNIGIKSIQTGYAELNFASANNSSATATLGTTLTNTSKAFMLLTGVQFVTNGTVALEECRPTITNTTTVTVYWQNAGTGTKSAQVRIYFLVVEFN